MDDLISRKSLLEKTHMADVLHAIRGITKSVEVVLADDVEVAPSVFDGKTNGDVMKAVYADSEICIDETYKTVEVFFGADGDYCEDEARFDLDWWNAPYKGVSK